MANFYGGFRSRANSIDNRSIEGVMGLKKEDQEEKKKVRMWMKKKLNETNMMFHQIIKQLQKYNDADFIIFLPLYYI